MPIAVFENRRDAPLAVTVEPFGDEFSIPHLATIGIRYSVIAGEEDRTYSYVDENKIDFWCNSTRYETDIVLPTPRDRLFSDICVNGGWCGGVVDGKHIHVSDLLPTSGQITAEEFALLVDKAESSSEGDKSSEKMLMWLADKFIEHFGTASVQVDQLRATARRPFDPTI